MEKEFTVEEIVKYFNTAYMSLDYQDFCKRVLEIKPEWTGESLQEEMWSEFLRAGKALSRFDADQLRNIILIGKRWEGDR